MCDAPSSWRFFHLVLVIGLFRILLLLLFGGAVNSKRLEIILQLEIVIHETERIIELLLIECQL